MTHVLNYCGLLVDCRGILDAVLGDAGLDDKAAASTPFERCICELLTLLLRNIDDKSWQRQQRILLLYEFGRLVGGHLVN